MPELLCRQATGGASIHFRHSLDDPHPAPYRTTRRLAHGDLKAGSRPENGNPLPRTAKGRPDSEKICIRFDD